MNAEVLPGSHAVRLAVPVEAGAASQPPRLQGLILSLVRFSGAYEAGRIEVAADGLTDDFDGSTWRAAWQRSDSGWDLHLGLPDALFTAGIDAVARLGIEVLSSPAGGRTSPPVLAVSVLHPAHAGELELPVWWPEMMAPSTGQTGL